MNNNNSLTLDDLVIYKGNNGISAGGYKINSLLMDNTQSNLSTSVFDQFKDLAVPAGLFFNNSSMNKDQSGGGLVTTTNTDKTVDMSLYDSLLNLASTKQPKKKSPKNKLLKTKKKTTKKKTTKKKTKRKLK